MYLDYNVCAIIILYNPKILLLKRLYESLYLQVNSIVFIDNSDDSKVKRELDEWLTKINLTRKNYLDLKHNYGIAHAQNEGIRFAKRNEADFVLFLDQDSSLPLNMVKELLKASNEIVLAGNELAAVGPSFLDEKTNEIAKIIRHENIKVVKQMPDKTKDFEITDYVISSGSLVSVKVLEEIGDMNEKLFIDWVDIEWCLRAKVKGYSCFIAPRTIMQHSIGDEYVDFGKRKINLHTDFRNYFIVRNSIYLSLYSKLPLNFRIIQLVKAPQYILFYSYYSKRPVYSLGLLTKAVFDGLTKNMGKGHFKRKDDV